MIYTPRRYIGLLRVEYRPSSVRSSSRAEAEGDGAEGRETESERTVIRLASADDPGRDASASRRLSEISGGIIHKNPDKSLFPRKSDIRQEGF